ncbi:hypothetical protein POF50_033290 [Streptomyces sp. SL13]|uniref:Uncharacterized protein n=1 Tax=Streptantibioticus silvisoli TaxID=2705255 RepID=A0AA90HCL8_9ACTN|nr:hypothetical protein [Streptantibioticus silvisoli]MDI5974164.1 hypothetical protein [Streptantibioticus silvisoli]
MSWSRPGAGRDREDEWVRSEQWSDRLENYREYMDTPERIDRMRRDDAAFRGKLYNAIAIPLGGYLAHVLQRHTHHAGFGWYLLFFLALVVAPQLLLYGVRRLRDR